jgi:hypothetical protein
MPISKHYGGHGDEVMSSMKKTYGDSDTAKRVFYATENKRKSAAKKVAKKRGGKR